MCACDEAFGRRFLEHQLAYGVELETQERVRVTHGFQIDLCNACRRLPLVPAPAAAIPGRTSKIKRFYWREMFFAETERMAEWRDANPSVSSKEIQSAQRVIRKEVLDELKELHATNPKYDTREPSQNETLRRYNVEVQAFHAEYTPSPSKGSVVVWENEVVSPEAFATRHYEALGWSVMQLESVPLYALFGVMMWLLIQDCTDPKNRMVGFGSRAAFEAGEEASNIITQLPEDFGTPGYGRRRAKQIEEHFALMSVDGASNRRELLDLFEYWLAPSEKFREYLWAHRATDVSRARRFMEIIPPEKTIAILRYLVDDYWGRYLGWPDLLLWRDKDFMLVEVKSSSDKLSADQMRWIADNHDILNLPFRVAKLHRKA